MGPAEVLAGTFLLFTIVVLLIGISALYQNRKFAKQRRLDKVHQELEDRRQKWAEGLRFERELVDQGIFQQAVKLGCPIVTEFPK